MEWVEALRGSIVCLDTAPLIYFIEEHPKYLSSVRSFFDAMDKGSFRVVTSTITLAEVLVYPIRQGDDDLAREYRRILGKARNLTTVPVSAAIADDAAKIRARHGLRTPDAIQVATAVRSGASFFLTNDYRISGLPSMKMLVLDKLE